MENWRSLDFLGYPDYQVSDLGNVRSMKTGHGRTAEWKILKPKKMGLAGKGMNQHLGVVLCKTGEKHRYMQVHRLVAMAFLPNPNDYPCVNHKDENPFNNRLDNLEWCTVRYNTLYGTCIERMKKAMPNALISEKVRAWRMNNRKSLPKKYKAVSTKTGESYTFATLYEAGEKFGLTKGKIRNLYDAVKREDNTAYGYIWTKIEGVN